MTSPEYTERSDLLQQLQEARQRVVEEPASEERAQELHRTVAKLVAVANNNAPAGLPAHPAVVEADRLIAAGHDEPAEVILREHLRAQPTDTAAMHLMATLALNYGFLENAVRILRRAVAIEPQSPLLWVALGKTLYQVAARTDQIELVQEALLATDEALRAEPDLEAALTLKASILVQQRRMDEAEPVSRRLLEINPTSSEAWTNHGYHLSTAGRLGDSVAAHRIAAAADPTNGEAWWGLANLKLARMTAHDIAAMEDALSRNQPDDLKRAQIHFALGKAYIDAGNAERAMSNLAQGNAIRRSVYPHDRQLATQILDTAIRTFSAEFFQARVGWGYEARDPIFIVGMPRSGSTLLEQILSSHSAVEGTEELFAIQEVAGDIETFGANQPQALEMLEPADCERFGARYLEFANRFRRTERPHFIDKNPANWHYVGLIHLLLPNAKIIDVRRNPLDCCFANYAQYFHRLMDFAFDLADLGREYSNYVRLMRHFDEALPGRVHRIIYEDLVEDLDGEVRRLLNYLDLPFEESCLRFFETERVVHTPSSQQVRQPINRAGIGRWRKFEPWLAELKAELGGTVEHWRT